MLFVPPLQRFEETNLDRRLAYTNKGKPMLTDRGATIALDLRFTKDSLDVYPQVRDLCFFPVVDQGQRLFVS